MNGCVMFCFFKQKTAYELRISVWSSDVCSSDLCARVSFDLIYARPGQSLAAWESELAGALAFGTGHLSPYQLTIEPGQRFATHAAKGDPIIPDGAAATDLFSATPPLTRAARLPPTAQSNTPRTPHESRTKHSSP